MIDFSELDKYKENNRLEVKKAKGGLPNSLWETYSAFANSGGGVILLGITELDDGSLIVTGVPDINAIRKDFWNIINNRQKVNLNILSDDNVFVYEIDGKQGLAIEVPRAARGQKPVYINNDLFNGSYRRNWEGDYHCTPDEVRNMLRDQADISQDTRLLEEMDLGVLDFESVKRYRTRMAHQRPGHVWEEIQDEDFLYRLGATAISKNDGNYHPTVAGLLMFGYEYEIVKEFSNYFLDYQEKMDETTRWTDRIVSTSGDWSGNLFDFYFRVYNRIALDVKTPFKIENGTDRVDDTPVHKALREALANALIHAGYYGRQGLVIKKSLYNIRIENPGCLRISKEEVLRGGNSDPRNATLIKMFNLINIGERAGSGVPNIYDIWKKQGFELPDLLEQFNPDRTILLLSFEKAATKSGNKKAAIKSGNKKAAIKSGNKKVAIKSGNKKITMKTEEQQKKIITYLSEVTKCKMEDIENLLGIKRSRAGSLLRKLAEEDVIEIIGGNRNRVYMLKSSR